MIGHKDLEEEAEELQQFLKDLAEVERERIWDEVEMGQIWDEEAAGLCGVHGAVRVLNSIEWDQNYEDCNDAPSCRMDCLEQHFSSFEV